MADNVKVASGANAFRTLQETSAVDIAPDVVLKQGAVNIQGNVLTVKNQDLANLIQSKLAAASQLTAGRAAASDADVSVSVKVHF